MRLRLILSKALLFVFVVLVLTVALQQTQSQDIFGTINGTVTDIDGKIVPGAKVTITNEETQISRPPITANDKGYFVASDLPVGTYTVTVDLDKFKTVKRTGNVLVAGGHLTVDVKMEVGAISETVQVSGTGVALETSSAEVSRVVDSKEIQRAALNERNYVQLITLLPGAVLTAFDQTTLTTGQGIAPANINGLRTDGNLLTVDGGYNLDSGSNGTQLNNVGINFIHEVNIQTSNYSAEYGRSAASSVNVVTNSGGNQFHGDVFEYGRNNFFDAKPAFSNKVELRYNDFGFDLGGPIIKRKLFFFGGVEWKRLVLPGDGPPKSLTLPTSPELAGNFADTGLTLKAQGTVTAASGCIGSYSGGATDTNPADFVANTATGTGSAINPSCITSGGKAIASIYKLMETPNGSPESATTFTNLPTPNNATFAPVTPQNWQEAILRLDYHPTDKHSLYIRGLQDHLVLVDPFGPFSPGGALPTSPQLRIRPGYGIQLGDVWTASANVVNEAKFNVSWNQQRIPPTGNLWQQATYGFNSTNFPLPFPGVGPFPTGIPSGTFSGTCQSTACPAEFLGPYEFLLAPTTDISPSDNVSWQVRNHTIKFGFLYARNRKDQNSRTDATQGQLNFSSSNPNTTTDQFADALLGNYNTLVQFSGDPIGHFRFDDYGSYIQDSWKVSRRLNIDFGVRIDYTVPTYTQGNNMVNFDPSLYTPIPGLTISGGTSNIPTAPLADGNVFDCPPTSATPGACNPGAVGGGFVIDGLVRPGGVPPGQLGRVPNGESPFVLDVPASAQRGFFKPEVLASPHVGIAYVPFGEKTVIRAGAGMYYDKPEGNIIFGQTGIVPFLQQLQFNSGNLAVLPAAGAIPTVFNLSADDPHMVVARDLGYSLSVQHEFQWGIMFQAAYVGNHAWHLIREPNINVPTFATAMAAPKSTAINQIRPFLGYGDISQFRSDGTSNYNSLQISAAKTKGDITIQVSYTYGQALGDANGLNDNPEPECAFTCVNSLGQTVSWKRFDYGPLSFDIKSVFVASYTLTEPFFKNRKGAIGEVISGWSITGITRAQNGFPLTVSGSASLAASSGNIANETFTDRAFMVSGQSLTPGITTCATSPTKLCYFNTAAFTSTGMTTGIGNAPIGNIIGPGYYSWDLSLRKSFRLPYESMGFTIELDAFNAFNRINYGNPSTTVTSSSFGQVTTSQPPRNVQLGAKFSF
ncbi:MAG TPA: TonB-dependent receptor [Candidatus Acidoferrales bacterium]|nr:TonB-dependent receptor [Candidatus Acidoferrales bacterium]